MIFRYDDQELLVERKGANELCAIASAIIRCDCPPGITLPASITLPTSIEDCRNKDNSRWILWRWLSGSWANMRGTMGRRVGVDLWKRNPSAMLALIEAYTARVTDDEESWSYEQHCCDGSTGVPDDQMPCDVWCKDPAAVSLGRKGGLKGGAARAKSMSKKQRTASAKKASAVRWEGD